MDSRLVANTRAGDRAEFILKVSERCNLACSYCYFFESPDQSYRSHPPVLTIEKAREVGNFISTGCQELGLEFVRVDLHGGEPLLLGPERFASVCTILGEAISPYAEFEITTQTNATLITPDWISLFERFGIHVGVSVDGPRDLNDKFRTSPKGRGSYDATLRGIRLLQTAARHGRIAKIGILAVIDPYRSSKDVYRHLVHAIGADRLNFLLPNMTHDDELGFSQEDLGIYLSDALDEWILTGDYKRVRIRLFDSILSLLLGGRSQLLGIGAEDGYTSCIATIASDGSLSPDDTLRSCGADLMFTGMNIVDTSFATFLSSKKISHLELERTTPPEACRKCCWYAACGGGFMPNRYRRSSGFNNESVFCLAMKILYARAAQHLLHGGLTIGELAANLHIE